MRKRKAIKLLKEDFEDYYNMSDRVSELISVEGSIKPIKKYHKTITFRKSAFILSCCIGCAFIIGGSVGTTAYVIHCNTVENSTLNYTYKESVFSAITYSTEKLKCDSFDIIVSYPVYDYCVFNLYEASKEGSNYYFYQIYTVKSIQSEIIVRLIQESQIKQISLPINTIESIGILNDDSFEIQKGKIKGEIYCDQKSIKNFEFSI